MSEFQELDLSQLIDVKSTGEREFTPEFCASLVEFQAELPSAKKNNVGYGYKYSDLGTVIDTAKPVLHKHGLGVIQILLEADEKTAKVETVLFHKTGGRVSSVASIPIVEMKGCNIGQRYGASVSYLRRYAYQSIIGMASEDNDASSEGFKKETKTTKKKTNNSWS